MKQTACRLGLVLSAITLAGCGVPDAGTGDGAGGEAPALDHASDEAATGSATVARQTLEGAVRAMGGEAVANVRTIATPVGPTPRSFRKEGQPRSDELMPSLRAWLT